jgi:hypothetical protein
MAFADDIEKFAEKSVRNAGVVHKRIALELFRRIVLKTPVDTGRLRANWQAASKVYVNGTVDAEDPGGDRTVAAIVAAVEAGELLAPLTLVNNLPYARRIEYDSWSRQAPAGMVRTSIAELQGIVGDAVKVE